MRSLIIFAAAVLVCAVLCGCSIVKTIVGEEKYTKIEKKLDKAWSEVGKDALRDLTDDTWRQFGFGKTIDWPKDNLAQALPILRDGKISACYSDGTRGYIRAESINQSEFDTYLSKYLEKGFKKTVQTPPFSTLVTFNDTYVGFIYDGSSLLSIYYADSFPLISDLIEKASNS
ncbi:MAG: hypothetical protein RR246_04110 [Clostridia bacterium]